MPSRHQPEPGPRPRHRGKSFQSQSPGEPVIAAPGYTPRSPLTTVPPVLVTAAPPSTPKLVAVPSENWALACGSKPADATTATRINFLLFILLLFILNVFPS